MQKTINELKVLITRVIPGFSFGEITTGTRLREDLGIDSLNMMLIAITIEDEYHISFDSVTAFETVGDICDYIEEKLNEKK